MKDSMDSNEKIVRSILITFLVTAVFICGCGFVLLRYTTVLDGVWMQRNESTGKITSVMENVLNGYIEELDEETLIDGAMKGMLEAVDDPYTFYLTAEEYENMEASRSPSYTGIGVTVNMVDVPDAMLIMAVTEGGGAQEAGILAGDEIVAVEGVRCTEENKTELSDQIAGDAGTFVNLTIRRGEDELNFNIERREIRVLQAVGEKFAEDQIGYIRLRSFHEAPKADFMNLFNEMMESDVKALIIDLRGNGGGYKNVAVELADLFLPEGDIYTAENNKGVVERDVSDADMIQIPFVVLVDGNSASASELFAGAVQDYGVGLLIGTQTFGKGIVQYTYQLQDGSYYQYTAENWLTPNGNSIQGVGLTPDIVVENEEEVQAYIDANPNIILEPEIDKQLAKAIEVLLEEINEQ